MTNNRNKVIKSFVFLFLILALSFFVYFKNQKEEQEIYKIRKELLSLNKIPNDDDLLNKKKELLQKESFLNERLFDKDNPINFIEMVENLGLQNAISITVDNVNLVEENIVLNVSATGELENIKNFVFSLENSDKEITIKNIRFNKIIKEKGVTWGAYLNIIGKTK